MYRFPRGKTVTAVRSIAQGNVSQPPPLGRTQAWSIYCISPYTNSRTAEIMRIICSHHSSYCAVVLIFTFFFKYGTLETVGGFFLGGGGRYETPDLIKISCATGNCFWPIVLPIKTYRGQLKNRWQRANIKSATNFVSIKPLLFQKALHVYSDSAKVPTFLSATIGLLHPDLENRDIYGYSTEKRCGVWHEFGKSLLRIPRLAVLSRVSAV